MKKFVFGLLSLLALSVPAFADNDHDRDHRHRAPEIDGSLAIQFAALAGGIAVLLKRKS